MKYLLSILLLLVCSATVFGQQDTVIENGVASYVSSQNVYVKFSSTEHIKSGDTLFIKKENQLLPALLVKDKSSTSCVCKSLLTEKLKVGDAFVFRSIIVKEPEKVEEKKVPVVPAKVSGSKPLTKPTAGTSAGKEEKEPERKEKIRGRVSAAAYSNVYGSKVDNRMHYTLSFQGTNIKKTRFSADTYISFRHTIGEWNKVQANLSDALKVYSLAVKYDIDKTSNISLGRKINYRISSMGAIDGLQYEKKLGYFSFGLIGGWRPDFADYGFNFHLFETGAYIGHSRGKNNKSEETTLAFVEQKNHLKTDRRFVYFQHSNAISNNLNVFFSFETDLYQNINNEVTHAMSITNMLLSIRYKASKKLNFSLAYDNRKNIIYYESYKSYIDQLIEDETRQGLRFGGSYRFSKFIYCGFNASWRFQKSGMNSSKNINSYVNFNRIPWIKSMLSLSANFLQTNYLDSKLLGAQLSKDLVRNKLNGDVYYRMSDYQYKNYENHVLQHIAGVSLSWNLYRKLGLYLYYEGTFDKKRASFNRVNLKIVQRF